MSKFKRGRPTIGILPGWSALGASIPDRYSVAVLKGIQAAARLKECHLLLAWGLGRVNVTDSNFPAWPVLSTDSDFVPVGPWNTDGLIVLAPLRDESRSRYLRELGSQGFPILFFATGEGDPMIYTDNEGGIHQAVAHFVQHGHRSIAFLAGDPDDQGDSESRLRAYHSAMAEQGLETDSALIADGWHSFAGGYEGTQKIIGSGVQFTALIASDDISAIGAMQAIRDAGLRIPGDVAVIGFDDQPDAVAQVPPLASIHVSLGAMGEQAFLLMFDHLSTGSSLESVRIPTRLVPRQSCGCIPQVVSSAGRGGASTQTFSSHSDPGTNDMDATIQNIVDEMTASLAAASHIPFKERTNRLCTGLVQAFYVSLKDNRFAHFQAALMGILQELEFAEENIDSWQSMISTLRREMTQLPAAWTVARTRYLAEDMLHEARAAISESAQRQDYRHQYHQQITAQILSELTARLSATLDEREAVESLESHLTEIGIRHVRVALFESEADDPVAWSALLNSNLGEASRRFQSREFPPRDLYPADELLNLALVPLVFQDEALGYIAFDGGNLEPCGIIARQLAATFKAARLHAQVIELSLRDPLTSVHNRRYFDLFLTSEVDRSKRLGGGLAIIMLDIDHFKMYNDTYGHPAGDKALQAVAEYVKRGRRNADVVARIGGEEFALILPQTQIEGAQKVAERIRAAIINSSAFESALTVSMGISISSGVEMTPETLIKQADLALYEAKRSGRNRICVYKEEGSIT